MRKPDVPRERWRYDAFGAFHVKYGPLVLFDTGELICTQRMPRVSDRFHDRSLNVELTTTAPVDRKRLWAPDGRQVKTAWLDDNGQQHLLIDHDLNVAVRLDGPHRYRASDHLAGVPERFQANAYGYIGGPGCHPVGAAKIAVRFPHKLSLTLDEQEHVAMLVTTFRAAMKLTDDPCVTAGSGLPMSLDIALKCATWQDVPDVYKPGLFHHGVGRRKSEFDYLLTVDPK